MNTSPLSTTILNLTVKSLHQGLLIVPIQTVDSIIVNSVHLDFVFTKKLTALTAACS